MKKYTIGVFFGTLLHENMGCNALNYSFMQCCTEVGIRIGVSFKYVFYWDIPSSFKKDDLPVELQNYDIEFQKVPDSYLRLLLKGLLKDKMHSYNEFFYSIKKCDFFVDTCGGDSFSDIYGLYTLKYIYKNHALAKKYKKDTILLPQTIGPFSTNEGVKRAAEMLKNSTHIFVRDILSKDVASKYISDDKITQTIDMAFYMDYMPTEKLNTSDNIYIGLSPSALLWNGGYTANNQFGLKEDYKTTIYKIIEYLNDKNYQIVLLGHVLYGTASKPREDDYWLCKRLQRKYPFCKMAPFFYTPMEAKSFISSLDGLMSSRMHCCIGAYSSGVPVFTLGYSRKFNGLFEETLNYPYGTDLRKDSMLEIMNKVDKFLSSLDAITTQMPDRNRFVKEQKEKFIQTLTHTIELCIKK